MAAFLSLLQESVLTHAGIARIRWPQVRTYLHLCHCKTRCERGRPSRSRAAAHFIDGEGPASGSFALVPDTTPIYGRCCFHFSSPSFQTHSAPSSTSAPRPLSPVFPFRERERKKKKREIHVIRTGAGSSRREGACARPAVNKHRACALGQGFLSFVLHSKKKKKKEAGVGWRRPSEPASPKN